MPRNPLLISLALFLFVSLIPCISKPDSLRDLVIFMMTSISSFESINATIPDPKIFIRIAACVADTAVVNPALKHFQLMF